MEDKERVESSSKVTLMLVKWLAVLPTVSDMSITFCPPGPPRRMSRSFGYVWARLLKVTLTLTTALSKFVTKMAQRATRYHILHLSSYL